MTEKLSACLPTVLKIWQFLRLSGACTGNNYGIHFSNLSIAYLDTGYCHFDKNCILYVTSFEKHNIYQTFDLKIQVFARDKLYMTPCKYV